MREENRLITRLVLPAAVSACLLLACGCAGRRGPESPDETAPPRGQSSFDFLGDAASSDTIPPEDQDLRAPMIAEVLAQPVYPPQALIAGAGPAVVAVRILVDTRGRVAEVADSPRLASSPGPFAADFRRAVEDVLTEWRFVPAVWRRYEPGEDLDGDGVADYRRVVEHRVVNFYLDVRFDFEIVDGQGRVRSDQTPS
jgi:hypothetical protein